MKKPQRAIGRREVDPGTGRDRTARDALRSLLICLLLSLATLTTFSGVAGNAFVWDDSEYVAGNQGIAEGLTRETVIWAFTTAHSSNWHPLTWLSHALDIELYGLDSAGHHGTSLVIHLMSTLLLFLVLQRMTGAPWRSAAVAGLFALHPLRVESVAWISERKDVLSAFFWIATIGAYASYARRGGGVRYAACLALFALGLMSKQMLVTLPFVLLLLDYWPLGRLGLPNHGAGGRPGSSRHEQESARASASLPRLVLEKIPFLLLAVVASLVVLAAQSRGGSVATLESFPLGARIENALVSYVAYIGKLAWPSSLSAIYPFRSEIPWWQLGFTVLALGAVTIFAIRSLRRRPYLAVGWFWYLGTLVPVIGLVQIGEQSMADRYTYIPSIGLLILLCWLLPDVLGGRPAVDAVLAMAALTVMIALAVQTSRQLTHWRSDETLFEHALRVTTDNHVAHLNLGMVFVSSGRIDAAVPHFERVVQIRPDHALAHNNLGMAALHRGDFDQSVLRFERAVSIDPEESMFHVNLATALAAVGRLDRAAEHDAEARRLRPDSPVAASGLGLHIARLGTTMLRRKQFAAASELLAAAVRLEPSLPSARVGLAHALLAMGSVEEALGHYETAVSLDPGPETKYLGFGRSLDAQAHFGYGHTLAAVGETVAAASQYREALRRDPDMSEAKVGLAWLFATAENDAVRNPLEAAELASSVCRSSGNRDPKALDALAAAHAASGRFREAIEVAELGVQAARRAGRAALADAIERRIAGYQARRAYTERAINLAE